MFRRLEVYSWTPFSDVLTSGRTFLEEQTEKLVSSPTTHQKEALLKHRNISQQPGKATAQCAIIPDDIVKVLEI